MRHGFDTSAKSIDSGQPAWTVQADLDRNFLLSANFPCVQGSFTLMILPLQKKFYGSIIRKDRLGGLRCIEACLPEHSLTLYSIDIHFNASTTDSF